MERRPGLFVKSRSGEAIAFVVRRGLRATETPRSAFIVSAVIGAIVSTGHTLVKRNRCLLVGGGAGILATDAQALGSLRLAGFGRGAGVGRMPIVH